MAIPIVQFTDNGITVPKESDIYAGIFAAVDEAFGGGLTDDLTTPQGQLVTAMSEACAAYNAAIALLVNQVDPQFSYGRMQDGIGRIYFIDRRPATATVVDARCSGGTGTVIPVGALARDVNGIIYSAITTGTIGIVGYVDVTFQAQTTGPIACAIGELTTIYTTIPGWESVTNLVAGVVGSDEETRNEFEVRRADSVSANARGVLSSIYGTVSALAGVLDVYVTENVTSSITNVGSTAYALAPHSLYVAAVGGDSAEIAEAIFLKNSAGCDYNGNTTVTVYDTDGYEPPYPSYDIKFNIPSSLRVYVALTLASNTSLPADIVAQAKQAIVDAFNGADGGPRARIAKTIYASRYYAGVSKISPYVGILSLYVGIAISPTGSQVAVGIDQVPTLDAADITVAFA